MDFKRYKALTFDCYGTLIDWEAGIADLIRPWQAQIMPPIPTDLILSAFALMQAKHQQVQPALLYPEVLKRSWRDVEETFGWEHNAVRADSFAASVGDWPPFLDTVESLRYLSRFCRLAILSNVDNASLTYTMARLEVPFALTVTAEDVGAYKPNLAHFQTALARLASQGYRSGRSLACRTEQASRYQAGTRSRPRMRLG